MPLYVFETNDGQRIEKIFSVKDCPKSITLEDGTIAYKIITCPHIANSAETKAKIKKQQTQKNIDAGNRGRSFWKKQFGDS